MSIKKIFKNKNLYLRFIPMSIAATCIIFFAVKNALYPPNPEKFNLALHIFKTLPTLVTLAVQLLLMSANKYGFLLGGTNAAIYGIVYILSGAPFSAVSALLISFPLQIYSFFNWKKNSSGKTVELRWLPLYAKFIVLGITVALWAFCYFVLAKYNILPCKIPVLDTIIFTLGTVVTVLSSIRFIDSQYISFVSASFGLIMWILLTIEDPSTNISHAIIAVYNLYCIGLTAINWTSIYNKSKKKLNVKS